MVLLVKRISITYIGTGTVIIIILISEGYTKQLLLMLMHLRIISSPNHKKLHAVIVFGFVNKEKAVSFI